MALKGSDVNSLIGDGSIFEGKFYIKGSLQIDGKFQGVIKTDDHLIISETGKVKTNINTRKATIGGTLIGDIDATEEVVLLETGRILGNIKAPKIDMHQGVVTKGMIEVTGGQKKDIDKLIKDSFNSTPGFEQVMTETDKLNPDQKLRQQGKKDII
jgi:cytoskeletal protein CcmA (bactofilin family)